MGGWLNAGIFQFYLHHLHFLLTKTTYLNVSVKFISQRVNLVKDFWICWSFKPPRQPRKMLPKRVVLVKVMKWKNDYLTNLNWNSKKMFWRFPKWRISYHQIYRRDTEVLVWPQRMVNESCQKNREKMDFASYLEIEKLSTMMKTKTQKYQTLT